MLIWFKWYCFLCFHFYTNGYLCLPCRAIYVYICFTDSCWFRRLGCFVLFTTQSCLCLFPTQRAIRTLICSWFPMRSARWRKRFFEIWFLKQISGKTFQQFFMLESERLCLYVGAIFRQAKFPNSNGFKEFDLGIVLWFGWINLHHSTLACLFCQSIDLSRLAFCHQAKTLEQLIYCA